MNYELDYILSARAVRETTAKVWDFTKSGGGNFEIIEDKLGPLAHFVCQVIKENYPSLDIPYHSRWGHFKVGTHPRVAQLMSKLEGFEQLERARIMFDLVVPSVLLDAGAGPGWKYKEDQTGEIFNRSEGLAVASFDMFMSGAFARDSGRPLSCDGQKLVELRIQDLEKGFQVSSENSLVGLSGRLQLLNNLGKRILESPEFFSGGRVGGLVDFLINKFGKKLQSEDLLQTVLLSLGPIWPGRLSIEGVNIGDVWHLENKDFSEEGPIAFHKLSQWLTYSLIEPLEGAGIDILNLHKLTGLAEYRNGGLFVDYGVLKLKNEKLLEQAHKPSDPLIVEWRALTLCLLDRLAPLVREQLNKSEEEFPLAKMLEGGTWRAGRIIANEKRKNGSPPIRIDSDGTIF